MNEIRFNRNTIICINCHCNYDLSKAEGQSRRLNRKEIYCPKCKEKVGSRTG